MSSHIIPKVDIRMSLRKGVSLITGMEYGMEQWNG